MLSYKKFSPINYINELNEYLNTSNESSSITDSSSKKFSVIQLNNGKINNLKTLLNSSEESLLTGGSINSSATSSAIPAMNTVSVTSSEDSSDESLEILPRVVNLSETEKELNQDTEKLLEILKNKLE